MQARNIVFAAAIAVWPALARTPALAGDSVVVQRRAARRVSRATGSVRPCRATSQPSVTVQPRRRQHIVGCRRPRPCRVRRRPRYQAEGIKAHEGERADDLREQDRVAGAVQGTIHQFRHGEGVTRRKR